MQTYKLFTFGCISVNFFPLCVFSLWIPPPSCPHRLWCRWVTFHVFILKSHNRLLITQLKCFVQCRVWTSRLHRLSCVTSESKTCDMSPRGLFILNMSDSFSLHKILISVCCKRKCGPVCVWVWVWVWLWVWEMGRYPDTAQHMGHECIHPEWFLANKHRMWRVLRNNFYDAVCLLVWSLVPEQ